MDPTQDRALKRTQFSMTNTSTVNTVTLAFGNIAAVANNGIVLGPGQAYTEASTEGFECWQEAVQAIGNGSATLSVSERFEQRG